MIKLTETVGHLGFYRVAIALNSRTQLPLDNVVYDASKPPKILPPSGMPSGTSDHADIENPAVFPVLADNFLSHETSAPNGAVYMGNVTLPNVNCDRCILQLIEFMHPHGYNGTPGQNNGGGYFYHHCAELKITADPTMPIFSPGTDGGTPDAQATDAKPDISASGSAGAGGAGSGAAGGGGTAGLSGSGGAGSTGSAGTGGSPVSGNAGSPGTAGATTGSAGSTTGSAGSTVTTAGSGGATGGGRSSGGGCNVSGESARDAALLAIVAAIGAALLARRRQRA